MRSVGIVLAALGIGFIVFCIAQIGQKLHYSHPNFILFKFLSVILTLLMYVFPFSLLVMGAFYLFKRWSKDYEQKQDLLDIRQQKEKYEAYRRGEYKPTYEELQNWSEPF